VGKRLVVIFVGDDMPHGKICYLEIPAKTAEASAFAVFADPVGNEFGLYEEPSR
jgi:hypothetical protein